MDVKIPDWRQYAAQLAAAMDESVSDSWRNVVASVPRHVLIPQVLVMDDGGLKIADFISSPGELYLDKCETVDVHPDDAAITRTRQPSQIIALFEGLDIRPGVSVLEVGLDCGYSTALLARALGDDSVTSIDSDVAEVVRVRDRLASIDLHPTVAHDDDFAASHGAFDRVIVTDEVDSVPAAWVAWLKPGGLLSAELALGRLNGVHLVLRRVGDGAEGNCIAATLSSNRRRVSKPHSPADLPDLGAPSVQATSLNPTVHSLPEVNLLLHVLHPHADLSIDYATTDTGTAVVRLRTAESWAQVDLQDDDLTTATPRRTSASRRVLQAGKNPLWAEVEAAFDQWAAAGFPAIEEFHVSLRADSGTLSVNGSRDTQSWPLP